MGQGGIKEEPVILSGHGGPVTSLAFDPDGRYLITGDYAGTIHRWDPVSDGQSWGETWRHNAHKRAVVDLAISPDGRRLISTAGHSSRFLSWVLRSDAPPTDAITLGTFGTSVRHVIVSPDGRWIIGASNDGTSRIWPLVVSDFVSRARRVAGREFNALERQQYGLDD